MKQKTQDQCNPLLISSTLLGSANDLIQDHFRKNAVGDITKKADILTIITNIESNVARIKDRLVEQNKEGIAVKDKLQSFPPPPFIPISNKKSKESKSASRDGDGEDDASLSTLSSDGDKKDDHNEKSALHIQDEKLNTQSNVLTPVQEGVRDRRKQSRRLSLPHMSPDIKQEVCETFLFQGQCFLISFFLHPIH